MYLERNPFSKEINDQIASIIELHTENLKAEGKKEDNQRPKPTTWEGYLSSSILNQKMAEDYTFDICEEARLYKFKGKDVPNYISKLPSVIKNLLPNKNVRPAGGFYYPPGGFMGWHNNCKSPGLRLYISYASHANKSFFRYLNEKKEIVNDYDDKGVTLRLFDIPKEPPHFWHCVGSDCDRYSVGFKLSDK